MLLGLGQRSLDEILQFLVDNNFNAIRIPFSTKWALDYDSTVRGSFRDGDIDGQLSRRAFLNKVISRAADFKILVMLDSHRKFLSLLLLVGGSVWDCGFVLYPWEGDG